LVLVFLLAGPVVGLWEETLGAGLDAGLDELLIESDDSCVTVEVGFEVFKDGEVILRSDTMIACVVGTAWVDGTEEMVGCDACFGGHSRFSLGSSFAGPPVLSVPGPRPFRPPKEGPALGSEVRFVCCSKRPMRFATL
jgi:hypothetical protein